MPSQYYWTQIWQNIAYDFLSQISRRVEEIDEDKWYMVCHSKI